jgi:MFS family permease
VSLPRASRSGVRLVLSHALGATAISLPWPLLLAQVWSTTGSDAWLGLTGAVRLLPYVLLSVAAGILADRFSRPSVLRWSAALRALMLAAAGVAVITGHLGAGVGLAALSVAASTPAYPAAVAAMPRLGGSRTGRLTDLLVTTEVAAFVVGPAIGGVLIGLDAGRWALALGPVLGLGSWVLLTGIRSPGARPSDAGVVSDRLAVVLGTPGARTAIAVVAVHNFVEAIAGVALLSLSHTHWLAGDRGFGVGTAALGFGSLAAPLLAMVLRMRSGLLVSAGGIGLAGVVPGMVVGAGPLAVAGAAGTVVECVSTEVLQRSVPDRVRAFALGLADAVMVGAAMLGALLAPWLASSLGPVALFLVLAGLLTMVAVVVRPATSDRRAVRLPVVEDQPADVHPVHHQAEPDDGGRGGQQVRGQPLPAEQQGDGHHQQAEQHRPGAAPLAGADHLGVHPATVRRSRQVRTLLKMGDESAGKPDSVLLPKREGDHPSATAVTSSLVRSTRRLGRAALERLRRRADASL